MSVVAPIAVACTYASIKHLRIAPTWMTGSSIPPSRARVPTKTSPPCGLAGFKKGFAGVAGVGSNRWGLNVLVDWVIVFFCDLILPFFPPPKNSAKKTCSPVPPPPQEANAQESRTDGAVRGLDERWA